MSSAAYDDFKSPSLAGSAAGSIAGMTRHFLLSSTHHFLLLLSFLFLFYLWSSHHLFRLHPYLFPASFNLMYISVIFSPSPPLSFSSLLSPLSSLLSPLFLLPPSSFFPLPSSFLSLCFYSYLAAEETFGAQED